MSTVGTVVRATTSVAANTARRLNAAHRRITQEVNDAFEEGKHPRGEGGKFSSHKEVLEHHGWKPGGMVAGYFNHPKHPGHQVAVRATKYAGIQEWSHSVAKRAGAKTRRGLNMGNSPESLHRHLQEFHSSK